MADGVLIKIDGEDSGYSAKLKNAEKKAKETAEKAQKAAEEANKAVQDALEATDEKVKASAEKTVKETKKAAKEAMAEAKKAADEYSRLQSQSMKNSADVVSGINKGVKTLAVAGAAAGAAVLGIGTNYNMQMEQYNTGFSTMLGNAERANELMNDLKGFAETTPFELTDLADASTTLLAFGGDVEDLMPDLKMLGDISLGNKEKFKSLALVFGQVQSQGKLMGQDLLQMINSGFNPLQIISEKTGKSVAQLKDEMSKGAITFDMVADAMRTATSEGGQFFNAMENQSKTAKGQISTLTDNVTAFFGKMSEGFSEVLAEDVLPAAIEGVEWLTEKLEDGSLEDFFKKAAVGAAGFGAAVGAMNIALIANDIINLKKGTEAYTAATKLGTAAQKLFNAELLKSPYVWAGMALAALVAGVITYAATHETAAESIKKDIEEIRSKTEDLNESYKEAEKAIDDKRKAEEAEALKVNSLKNRLYELEDSVKSGKLTDEEAARAKNEFAGIASQLEGIIPGITDNLYDETGAIDIQRDSVNNLATAYVNLMLAKAKADAYQSKITKLYELQNDQRETFADAVSTKMNADIELNRAKQDAQNSSKKIINDAIFGEGETYDTQVAAKNLADAQTAMEEASNAFVDTSNEIKRLSQEAALSATDLAEAQTEFDKLTGGGSSGKTTGGAYSGGGSSGTSKTDKTKKEIQDEEKLREEAYRKELRDHEHHRKMGKITDMEYYQELAKTRDKYCEEESEEWQRHTEEIAGYLQKTKEDVVEKWKDAFEEIEDKRQSLADNLKSDNKAFTRMTFDTGKHTETASMLADVSADNNVLQRYSVLLDKLSEKTGGDIPQQIREQLSNLSANDATEYLHLILRKSDEDLEKYLNDINENTRLSEGIADKLYVDEFENLAESFGNEFTDEFEEVKQAFIDEFGAIPEDFFTIGEDSGDEFKQGFLEKYKSMLSGIKTEVEAMLSTAIPESVLNGIMSQISNTNIYNDNRSTTINAHDSSVRGIIEAENQRSKYEEHTAKWGE